MTPAVVFDVDFTLIYPGPTFRGEGYEAFLGATASTSIRRSSNLRVASAASLLDDSEGSPYDARALCRLHRHIIEQMGGRTRTGALDACAREIYAEWARSHHFELYDDVPAALATLTQAGMKIGLISNSHRRSTSSSRTSSCAPFIAAAVSSADHGYMKPHPSIFLSALRRLDVRAGAKR